MLLIDAADLTPHLAQLRVPHGGDIVIAIEQLPGGGKDTAVQQSKQGGLSGAGGAEQCNLLPLRDVQGQIPESDRRMPPLSELFAYSVETIDR